MMFGRLKHSWDQTATIWQVIAEVNRNSEQKPEPFSLYDIHPYREKELEASASKNDGNFWRRVQQARYFGEQGQEAILKSIFHGG